MPSKPPTNAVAIRIVCLDGPLAGTQTSVAPGELAVLHDPHGVEVTYRIDGLLSVFPGALYAARVVPPSP